MILHLYANRLISLVPIDIPYNFQRLLVLYADVRKVEL